MAGGRPKKPIDYETVTKLASIHCTQDEIAAYLDMSVRTLQRDTEFCHLYKRAIEKGKASLRRLQWKAAEKGDKTMLVWLGKIYLKQVDKQIVDNNVYENGKTPVDELTDSIDKIRKVKQKDESNT